MNISTMQLANGKIEVHAMGITVATCDTFIQASLVARALMASETDENTRYWMGKVLHEHTVLNPKDDNDIECDCGDCDVCGHMEPPDDMDGDAASALASAGYGTDEDYYHDTPLGEMYGGE